MSENESEYVPTKVCVVDYFITIKGTKGIAIQVVNENGVLIGTPAQYVAKGKLTGHLQAGMMYEVKAKLKDDVVVGVSGPFSWVGRWPNDAEATAMRAKQVAADVEMRAASDERKAADYLKHLPALAPLRKAYRNTNFQGQLAIEVAVLHYLRSNPLWEKG